MHVPHVDVVPHRIAILGLITVPDQIQILQTEGGSLNDAGNRDPGRRICRFDNILYLVKRRGIQLGRHLVLPTAVPITPVYLVTNEPQHPRQAGCPVGQGVEIGRHAVARWFDVVTDAIPFPADLILVHTHRLYILDVCR